MVIFPQSTFISLIPCYFHFNIVPSYIRDLNGRVLFTGSQDKPVKFTDSQREVLKFSLHVDTIK